MFSQKQETEKQEPENIKIITPLVEFRYNKDGIIERLLQYKFNKDGIITELVQYKFNKDGMIEPLKLSDII
jgi:hypothetical protein